MPFASRQNNNFTESESLKGMALLFRRLLVYRNGKYYIFDIKIKKIQNQNFLSMKFYFLLASHTHTKNQHIFAEKCIIDTQTNLFYLHFDFDLNIPFILKSPCLFIDTCNPVSNYAKLFGYLWLHCTQTVHSAHQFRFMDGI